MADPRTRVPDEALEQQLAALAPSIDWPEAPALATHVGARIRTGPGQSRRAGWWPSGRRVRHALLAAAALVLLLAAGVAALTFLLPGLRIVPLPAGGSLPPIATPGDRSASPGSPLGAALGLGTALAPDAARDAVGFEPLLPGDATLGPPDEAYVARDRIGFLWRASPALPETEAAGVGLVVTELEGVVDKGWYEKLVLSGGTTVEEVAVRGRQAWWVSGDPHQLVYRDAGGRAIEETRRVVGDVLIWRRDGVTVRIESALGLEATIRLAETFVRSP